MGSSLLEQLSLQWGKPGVFPVDLCHSSSLVLQGYLLWGNLISQLAKSALGFDIQGDDCAGGGARWSWELVTDKQ